MDTPKDKHPSKSSFCDASLDQEGAEKLANGSGSAQSQNEAQKLHINDNANTICLDTSIYSQDVQASAWQQSNLGEYKQLSLLKSTEMLNQSCAQTSQESPSIQTSETISPENENSICLQWDSPVQAHQTQEAEQDSNIQLHLSGERDLDALLKLNPASVLSNNLKELSDEDLELFLGDLVWQDTLGRLKQSRRESLEQDTRDSDCLSFPTLTSNARGTSRPAGQTKCEKWFKDNGLIPNGSQLGTKAIGEATALRAIAMIMGFPPNWFDCLSPTEPQAESEQGISQDEQLPQHKHQSPSKESSISTVLLGGDKNSPLLESKRSSPKLSIPCLVKQLSQPEVKGVIRKDEGDCAKRTGFANRFVIEVDSEKIFVSKLFVYPDFSKSAKLIPPTKQATPPSKTRRKKGDGTGYIYRRTVTRRDKQYQESYFRYRDESGKLKAKYIPQRLLDRVQEAESAKKSIADILFLLGGDGISRGEHSSTSYNDPLQTSQTKSDELISISRGEQSTPPSKKRRTKGKGTGYIECKPVKKNGKEYKQYWYHYEEWREGDRLTKKSKYISKKMRSQIQKMNDEKAPVEEILKVLRRRKKKP